MTALRAPQSEEERALWVAVAAAAVEYVISQPLARGLDVHAGAVAEAVVPQSAPAMRPRRIRIHGAPHLGGTPREWFIETAEDASFFWVFHTKDADTGEKASFREVIDKVHYPFSNQSVVAKALLELEATPMEEAPATPEPANGWHPLTEREFAEMRARYLRVITIGEKVAAVNAFLAERFGEAEPWAPTDAQLDELFDSVSWWDGGRSSEIRARIRDCMRPLIARFQRGAQ